MIRRLLSLFIAFYLIFTQTAQAYLLASLPYKYQHTTSKARTANKGDRALNAGGSVTNQGSTIQGNTVKTKGGDTLIEASNLDAQGGINLSATGYAGGTNVDGSSYEGRKGTVTLATVKAV